MNFAQPLIEATLLKRQFGFLAEVALEGRRKQIIYCPNAGPLKQCDVLGTRIWFSKAYPGFSGCLDTWELAEVDEGALVNINPAYTKILVREAVLNGKIPELTGFHCLQKTFSAGLGVGLELFWKDNGEQCFVHMESVWAADHQGLQMVPEYSDSAIAGLKDLMAVKKIGHQAMLLYCIQHTGVQSLCIGKGNHPSHHLLKEAIQKGVEVLAYGLDITVESMCLEKRLPLEWDHITSN